jgi:hypothetical protein
MTMQMRFKQHSTHTRRHLNIEKYMRRLRAHTAHVVTRRCIDAESLYLRDYSRFHTYDNTCVHARYVLNPCSNMESRVAMHLRAHTLSA